MATHSAAGLRGVYGAQFLGAIVDGFALTMAVLYFTIHVGLSAGIVGLVLGAPPSVTACSPRCWPARSRRRSPQSDGVGPNAVVGASSARGPLVSSGGLGGL